MSFLICKHSLAFLDEFYEEKEVDYYIKYQSNKLVTIFQSCARY